MSSRSRKSGPRDPPRGVEARCWRRGWGLTKRRGTSPRPRRSIRRRELARWSAEPERARRPLAGHSTIGTDRQTAAGPITHPGVASGSRWLLAVANHRLAIAFSSDMADGLSPEARPSPTNRRSRIPRRAPSGRPSFSRCAPAKYHRQMSPAPLPWCRRLSAVRRVAGRSRPPAR